jgi:uncharacterized protein YqjF (DUF2071 family)
MKQNWHDLLFAHWEVATGQVRRLVPASLDLDLFNGKAYVAVAPFHMSGIRARMLPALPGLRRFPELNVRTYVRYRGTPGVYFFSLDAANLAAVWSARFAYGLPYFHADMSARSSAEAIDYSSRRKQTGDPHSHSGAEFRGRYWPVSEPKVREKDSLEYFLTERYCLYAVRRGRLFRAAIHHLPWPLQDAGAEIELNTMATAAGIELPQSKPLLHFSRFLEVLIWGPEHLVIR